MYSLRFDMRAPGTTADQRADLYRAAVEMASYADANGCMSIAISEHHASDDGYLPSPFPMAAAMAAVTTNTAIVVAAALLPLYDPIRLAEDMLVIDHLSRGRAMFVLALGYRPVEYEVHGVDYERRGRIADEKLEVLLGALRGAAGTATPRLTPAPFSANGPAIAWGGASKSAARRAGRSGVSFFAQGSPPGLREAYEQAARDAGHEPGMCILPTPGAPLSTFVNDDLDAGWREAGPALLADAVPYFEWNEAAGTTDVTVSLSRSQTVEDLREERGSHRVVTVAEAVDIIRTYGMLSLHPLCGGLEPAVAWRYLRRVVDEVVPAVANSA